MAGKEGEPHSGGVHVSGNIGSIGGDIVGRDKYVSSPSIAELQAKQSRDRLREMLNQFDRRAVRDPMHEEAIYFMMASLRELRINIQRSGISTLNDPVVRLLLTEVREELEEIEDLASWIGTLKPGDDWPESLLDYRIFGGVRAEEDAKDLKRGTVSLQGRLSDVERFCEKRVQGLLGDALNVDLGKRRARSWPPEVGPEVNDAVIPVNTDRLGKDFFCLYLFGRIDQLKDRILAKLEKVRICI
jgi:hypothetical protein